MAKPSDKKSVNIDVDVAKEMAIRKAITGTDIYQLVREAWDAYKRERGFGRVKQREGITTAGMDPASKLDRIMNSGNAGAITALTVVIDAVERMVRTP